MNHVRTSFFPSAMPPKARSQNSSAPTPAILKTTAPLVKSVFRKIWNEFYAWEQAYSAKTIGSLSEGPLPAAEQRKEEERNFCNFISSLKLSEPRKEIIIKEPECVPYESYEYCTPTSSNIWKGDDSPTMPFIPYSDDPSFDALEHCRRYNSLAWEHPRIDPNCSLIQYIRATEMKAYLL